MKKYDIVVPKKYEKDGEEKTAWKNVGTMTYFEPRENRDGGFVLELNMFPETTFKVFEQKPKDTPKPEPKEEVVEDTGEAAPEDINW
jgi:hypothetical protein